MTVDDLKSLLTRRRVEATEQLEVVLPQVQKLEAQIRSVRADVARFEERRDRLAALGDERIEVPNVPGRHPELGQFFTFELEPLRSSKTGNQLAAEVQPQMDELTNEIRRCEREIKTLLGAGRR